MNVTPVKKIAIVQGFHLVNASQMSNVILTKLLQQYDPVEHIIGVKSVQLDLRDSHNGTVQYPKEGIVTCTDFRKNTACGHGLHFSFGHCARSLANTLVTKEELRAKFQLALLPTSQTVVVGTDKLKTPAAYIVHTGTFAEIFEAIRLVFPDLRQYNANQIVSQPRVY